MATSHQQLSELASKYLAISKKIDDERPDSYDEIHTAVGNPVLRSLHAQRCELKQKIIEYIRTNKIETRLLVCGDKAIEIHEFGSNDPRPYFKTLDAISL